MANISAAKDVAASDSLFDTYPMAAVKIWKGALVCLDSTGYATNGGDTVGQTFIGFAKETVDNSGGQAGDLNITVRRKGVITCVTAGADATFRGQTACLVDNQTVALASGTTNEIACGTIQKVVSATSVRVLLDPK